jgi:hypothetical protein
VLSKHGGYSIHSHHAVPCIMLYAVCGGVCYVFFVLVARVDAPAAP